MSKVISGKWVTPDNSPIVNGTLHLQLSGDATVSGTAQVAPKHITITLDATGSIPANTQILANDELTPSGTTYQVAVMDSNGAQVFGAETWSITGSSPINLNTMLATTGGVTYPSPLTSVGLSMPAEFTVTGSPLTANGNLTVTKVSESANTLWAGPTTGAAAAPTFRALVNADIPTPLDGKTLTTATLTSPTITNPSTTGTDSGAETLKNKTLNGAGSGNAVTLLNAQAAAAQITGTGASVNAYSFTIPAGTVGAGKGLRFTALLNHSVGTASVSYAFSLGGSAHALAVSAVTGTINFRVTIYNNPGVTNAQTELVEPTTNGTAIIGAAGAYTDAVDMTQAQTLALTFNVPNTDKITPTAWIVELIQ